MIAVSSITPGPVGVNVATFAGYTTSGILGSVIATASVVLPSLIIVIIVSKLLEQFKHNEYVKSIIYCLKPAGCGLLAAVGVNMFLNEFKELGEENLKEIIEEKVIGQKWNIDTVLINKKIKKNIGVKEENIIDSKICSVCHSDLIHSYRVEKEGYGLGTALIELKK